MTPSLSSQNRLVAVLLLLIVHLFCLYGDVVHAGYQVSTYAGYNSIMDGLPANEAKVVEPQDLIYNSQGELLVSDYNGFRIRKVDTNGIINTFAGKGVSSDLSNVPPLQAGLAGPSGMAFTSEGYMIVADYSAHRLKKITGDNVQVIGGDGSYDSYTSSHENVLATTVPLYRPYGVVIGPTSGDIYVSVFGHHCIRRIENSTGKIFTFAGTCSSIGGNIVGNLSGSKIKSPSGLSKHGSDLYIVDGNDCIKKVANFDSGGTQIAVVAGMCGSPGTTNGAPTSSKFMSPSAIVFSSDGQTAFISDSGNHLIRKWNVAGNQITTVAGQAGQSGNTGDGGSPLSAKLNSPKGIIIRPDGALIFSCSPAQRVRMISADLSTISNFIGSATLGDGYEKQYSTLYEPTKIIKLPSGDLVFTDRLNHMVRKIFTNGTLITIAGPTGLNGPNGIDYLSTGEIVFVDSLNSVIKKIYLNGTVEVVAKGNVIYNGDGKLATQSVMGNLGGIAHHPVTGELWIADSSNNMVRRVKSTDGTLVTMIGDGTNAATNGPAKTSALRYPTRIAFNSNGDLAIIGNDGQELRLYTNSTQQLSTPIASFPGSARAEDITIDSQNNIILMMRDGTCKNVSGSPLAISPTNVFNTGTSHTKGIFRINDTMYYSLGGDSGFIRVCINSVCTVIASGTNTSETAPLPSAKIGQHANSIAVLENGDFYISNGVYTCGIRKYSKETNMITFISKFCSKGISLNSKGELLAVSSKEVLKYNETLNTWTTVAGGLGDGGSPLDAFILTPTTVLVNHTNDDIIFSQTGGLRKISNGTITTIISLENDATGFSFTSDYSGIHYASGNNIYSYKNGIVTQLASQLNAPSSLFETQYGELIFSDKGTHTIKKINRRGKVVTIAGISGASGTVNGNSLVAKFKNPNGMVVSSDGSEMIVADVGNNLLRSLKLDKNLVLCDNVLSDDSTVCSGNGVCNATDQCTCQNGWFGLVCNLTQCYGKYSNESNVCSGNGICQLNGTCECNFGYGGLECENFKCFGKIGNDSCNTHGQCVQINTCQCDQYYSGLQCDVFCSGALNCSGHGQCTNLTQCQCDQSTISGYWNGTSCDTCTEGYFGDTCNTTICYGIYSNDTRVCSGNGLCNSTDQCACQSGWYGQYCNITSCYGKYSTDSDVCNNHGQCQVSDVCLCKSGWFGLDCNLTLCYGKYSNDSDVCSGRGTCINGLCLCQSGWFGLDCNLTQCYGKYSNESNVCSGNGICQLNGTCECNFGYGGLECENFKCFEKIGNESCNRHGQCVQINTCQCDQYYYGLECDLFCSGAVNCSGHGQCTNNSQCQCDQYYYGLECDMFCSGALNCSGHGHCTNNSQCQCEPNYSGLKCDIFCSGALNCSGHGQCTNNSQCQCDLGYYGDDCSKQATENRCNGTGCNGTLCYGIYSNDTTVCSGHGVCNSTDQCTCQSGWYGQYCNITSCYGKYSNDSEVCNNHGQCQVSDVCLCKSGWFGLDCHLTRCNGKYSNDSDVCSGNGICQLNGACECNFGYGGLECENFKCFEKIGNDSCNRHGQCVQINTCRCDQYYSGLQCDVFCSDAVNCSGHGHCTNNSQCQCDPNYSGLKCDIFCSGALNCSGHGHCTNNSQCQCDLGYYGDDCSKQATENMCNGTGCNGTLCYGIHSNDTSRVCSGHGHCTNNSQCQCDPNYSGLQCDVFCSGALNCSGHGQCTNLTQCQCDQSTISGYWNGTSCAKCTEGYYGEECLTRVSNPIFSNDFLGIYLTLFAPPSFIALEVPCSQLIHNVAPFGNGAICSWKDKKIGSFFIRFGSNSSIVPSDFIEINTNVFNRIDTLNRNNVLFVVSGPLNVVPPTAVIYAKSEVGSCENVTLDASQSFSSDGRAIQYSWSFLSDQFTSSPLIYITNSPRITIPFTIMNEGEYTVKLVITSTNTGTSFTTFTFRKLSYPIPDVNIIGAPTIQTNLRTPLFVKKALSISCMPEDSIIMFNWTQISGPATIFSKDSNNNLVIHEFSSRSVQTLVYRLILSFGTQSTHLDVNIQTSLRELSNELYISNQSSESAILDSDLTDVENTNELVTFKWSCQDITSNGPCSTEISTLLSGSNVKSVIIPTLSLTVKTLQISLNVTKGSRFVLSQQLVNLVTKDVPLPPIITKINIIPSISEINKGELLSIQLDINPSNCKLKWTMNGETISPHLTSYMTSPQSPFLIVDTQYLNYGSPYQFKLEATLENTNISSVFEHSISLNIPPAPCPCSFTPIVGVAFKTNFEFQCSCTAGNVVTNFGFIDDRTGALLPLKVDGEMFSTVLPSPYSGDIIQVYSQIKNRDTKEITTIIQNITMSYLKLNSIEEVHLKNVEWTKISVKMASSNLAKSIYNAANIARTISMMKNYILAQQKVARSSLEPCSGRGVYNTMTMVCDCESGFFKKDCSLTSEVYSNTVNLNSELMNNIVEMYELRNRLEPTSQPYFILQMFGLVASLDNFDELDDVSFSKGIKMAQNVLTDALNSDLTVLDAPSELMFIILSDNIYNHILFTKSNTKEYYEILFDLMEKRARMKMRYQVLGMLDHFIESDVASSISNLHLSKKFNSLQVDTTKFGYTSLVFPSNMQQFAIQTNRKTPVQFYVWKLVNIDKFNSSTTQFSVENSQIKEENTTSIKSQHSIKLVVGDGSLSGISEPIVIHFPLKTSIQEGVVILSNTTTSPNNNKQTNTIVTLENTYQCVVLSPLKQGNCLTFIQSTTITCHCNDIGRTMVLETSSKRTIVREVSIPPLIQKDQNGSEMQYLLILLLVPIVLVLVIGVVVIVICKKKKKPQQTEAPNDTELTFRPAV